MAEVIATIVLWVIAILAAAAVLIAVLLVSIWWFIALYFGTPLTYQEFQEMWLWLRARNKE